MVGKTPAPWWQRPGHLRPGRLADLGLPGPPWPRHPVKKPQGRELDLRQKTFNKVIRGIHGVAERANALFKVTFRALRRVSLDPGSITRIARATLALL